MRFGILKKFLTAFFVLSLLPVLVLSFYARRQLVLVGQSAVESSRRALLENSESLLEARAQAIARQVELFLQSAADDLRVLSLLPFDSSVYLDFSRSHRHQIWIRTGTPARTEERKITIPLYREVTYIGPDGIERIHIEADRISPAGRNLSEPFQTPFGEEDYFNRAHAISLSEARSQELLYVSHLQGRHIRKQEQLQGAANVEMAVGGASYKGIIRFAAPVFREGEFRGVVSLGLDHRHFMEYSQHILPIGTDEVVFPSYSSGNYAFLFDDEGWIITHPKFWDIRGYDRDTGVLADPVSPDYNEHLLKAGLAPFNLFHVPFIHINYRHIAETVLGGDSGVTTTSSVGGVSRILAFAPIRFNLGEFRKTGYFGGVTLGAQTDMFYSAVDETPSAIRNTLHQTVQHFVIIILIAGCVVGMIAIILAKHFTRTILLLVEKVKDVSKGHFEVSLNIRSGDEFEILGHNFEEMARQLETHRRELMQSLKELKASKKEIETYNQRLERQIDILKHVHYVSHFLIANFDKKEAFDIILRTCVKGLRFERAIFYLYDPETLMLECVNTYGFKPEDEMRALNMPYRIGYHECVPVHVFSTGEAVMVRDARTDPLISELDRRIAESGNTHSFAFAPIRIGDSVIGVLGADHANSKKQVCEEEMESLKIIANEAGMAVERARLMDEALKRREFIESIFSNMMSGLVVISRNGMVHSINRYAEQVLCLRSEDIIGQPAEAILNPHRSLLSQINKVTAHHETSSSDFQLTFPDGQKKHIEMTASCLKFETGNSKLETQNSESEARNGLNSECEGEGSERSVLLIFRDITQRKKMEMHLRRSDRLVSLGTLAAGIAHEIRNPLTGISLLLDDLHDRMESRHEDRVLMQKALEEIEKLDKIITELLGFASKPTPIRVMKDLNEVIDHTLFLVRKQCETQQVSIIRDIDKDIPPLRLDPEKMKQALLNILLNALNAMPRGGEIRMTARIQEDSDIFPGERGVEISISDTGPGISPDDVDYIFDPFFTRNPKGFGLGLSITHTIIEEHDGKIMVESDPGKGACFRIFLSISH